MKSLYKKDTKGKIRIWTVSTNKDELIQESGLVDGKLVEHIKVCKSKNVGKSNETSPSQQALLELESEVKSKLDEGYFLTQEEANNEVFISSMLAKSYDDYKHKIDWNSAYIQPKLDGMRCLAFCNNGEVKLMSRDGKEITTMSHIVKDLSKIKEKIILDGELYSHGLSFQENMKLIKKDRGDSNKIKYHVYDIISDEFFDHRSLKLISIVSKCSTLERVSTNLLPEDMLVRCHAINISQGYEGSIIRWGSKGYKINGRSENLLKYKDFQDIALKIIDVTPNEVNNLHGTPWFELNNKKFKAGCRLSHEEREDLLENKNDYIGKVGELRYFELTDENIPRFPVFLGLRLDKKDED